jgi:ComEC/Rec2-related protein
MVRLKSSFFICFTLSLIISLYFRDILRMIPFLFAACIVIGATGITLVSFSHDRARKWGMAVIALAIGFLFGSALDTRITNEANAAFTGIDTQRVTSFAGTCLADSTPLSSGEGTVVMVGLTSVRSIGLGASAAARGRVIVFVKGGEKLYAGERLECVGNLSLYEKAVGIDFSSGVSSIGYERLGYDSVFAGLRAAIVSGIDSLIAKMGYPASGFFKALFIGAKEDLESEMADSFKTTGTLHILALSGTHVGLIFALVNIALSPFVAKKPRLVASVAVTALYVFIAGASPSLVRAAIMIGTYAVAKLMDRETDPLNILAISAAIILLVDPLAAYSLSFQLSYLAMLGIFIIGDPIAKLARAYMPGFLAMSIAYSIGAQIFTLPLVIQSFGIFYAQGIVVTLILGPLTTIFLAGGIISLFALAAPLYPLHDAIRFVVGGVYELVFRIAEFFSGFGGITIEWSWPIGLIFIAILVPFIFNLKAIRQGITHLKSRTALEIS